MRNIIKALNYQSRRDLFIYVGIAIGVIIIFFSVFIDGAGIDKQNGGLIAVQLLNLLIGEGAVVFSLVSIVIVTRICGWDRNDKTMNYEIMSGHSRAEVLFARVITSIMWCALELVIFFILPVALVTVLKGWGENVAFTDIVARFLLALLPMLRFIMVYVIITFILDNSLKALIIGIVAYEGGIIISLLAEEFLNIKMTYILAINNMSKLAAVTNSARQVVDGKEIEVYKSALEANDIILTIVVSLVMISIYVFLIYKYYKKKDVS